MNVGCIDGQDVNNGNRSMLPEDVGLKAYNKLPENMVEASLEFIK